MKLINLVGMTSLILPRKRQTFKVKGVVFDGDSITSGYGASVPFPTNFSNRTTLPISNLGVSGETLANMNSTFVSRGIADLYNANSKNTLLIFAGVNDILFTAGMTLATLQTNLQQYCAKARAAGFKTYTATALKSATITSPQETLRNQYNTWMRSNWSSFCDGLIDVAAIEQLSGTPVPGTTYWYDGDHPTNAGHKLIADLLMSVFGVEEVIIPARYVQTDSPATGLTISADGLTVTASADARHVTTTKGAGGKVFVSHIWGAGPNFCAPGISNGTPVASYVGDSTNSIGCYDGKFCFNGSWAVGSYAADVEHVNGDVVDICYDRTTNKVWGRKNGGNWNNSGTADPVTGVGGYSLALAGTGDVYGTLHLDTGQTMTINCGSQPWAYEPPTGYLGIDR